jgi:hypothetical protein
MFNRSGSGSGPVMVSCKPCSKPSGPLKSLRTSCPDKQERFCFMDFVLKVTVIFKNKKIHDIYAK